MISARFSIFFMRACALILTLLSSPAIANDGFYQGGGSSLFPINNPGARVIEEKLTIAPLPERLCYQVQFRGRTLDAWKNAPEVTPPPGPEEYATVAQQIACSEDSGTTARRLRVIWRARAEYRVEALEDQAQVLMGFPLPTWQGAYSFRERGPEGKLSDVWDEVPVPSVADFHTSINGREVVDPSLVWLKLPDGTGGGHKTLGFTWQASFKKGEQYTLMTEYSFGASTSTGFSAGQEYREGEQPPWFVPIESTPEKKGPQSIYLPQVTLRLLYYLSPLRGWSGQAPERIVIRVDRPAGLPVAYLVPVEPKPSCVDVDGFQYVYHHQYPATELQVSMPDWLERSRNDARGWQALQTAEELHRWRGNLGAARVACCLAGLPGSGVSAEVKIPGCVKTCRAGE